MGTHLRVLCENDPMDTNMTGLDGFQKSMHPCALDASSLSIRRVKCTKEPWEGWGALSSTHSAVPKSPT